MLTAKAIGSHNRNCHSNKRKGLLDESKEGKKLCSMADDTLDHDDSIDEAMVVKDLKWMEVRMSPYKENKEESILIVRGEGTEKEDHSRRELFGEGQGTSAGTVMKHVVTSNRNFGNSMCSAYFNADINGSGVADLVALSQFGISNVGTEIHASDVQYSADMANFVLGLSNSQRNDLSQLLNATVLKVKRDERNPRMWKTTIPINPFLMRKQYCDGKNSFLRNIPIPFVQSVGCHAYVSLRECIRLRLAFGYPLERLELCEDIADKHNNVRTLMQSECCQRIIQKCKCLYKEPVLILFLKEWQDGYDPHSFSKANRGSAWIKMITIAEPHEHRNCREVCTAIYLKCSFFYLLCSNFSFYKYTYLITIGPSGISHEEVEKLLRNELLELCDHESDHNFFFSKIHGRDIRVHAEIICSLMDQPERRGANFMVGGNSLYGARWGYSVNLQEIHSRLVPCLACQNEIFQGNMSWNKSSCKHCAQWEMIRKDNFLHWKAPKGFPATITCHDGYLRPRKLDYGILSFATRQAHQQVFSGSWSKAECEIFLLYYCINKKAANEIVRHAQNMRALDALSLNDDAVEDYEALLERKRKYPNEFEPWSMPSFWTRPVPLKAQIDVPMHLIFLGVVQGVAGFIHSWLRKHGKFSNFMRLAEGRLNPLVKFKLSWLKMLPYKGDRLGGWVSENYVSFSRIANWFYLILDDLKPDEGLYKDPETPQMLWKATENRAWLKARGLQSDGKAKELQERVAKYINENNIPPLLQSPAGTAEDIHQLIGSMYDMVKCIMTFEVNHEVVQVADFYIKRFLTHLAHCDRNINPNSKVPFWISSYTYPCLLNLPAHMKEYGPLKNLWEGGIRGEGSLRYIKPMHRNLGLRVGWPVKILTRAYQKFGLCAVGASMGDDDESDNDGFEDDENTTFFAHDGFWKYPNSESVYMDYNDAKPLCLVSNGETYGAMIRTGQVVQFLLDGSFNVVEIREMNYHFWKPAYNKDSQVNRGLILLDASEFTVLFSCVLLPLKLSNDKCIYSAVRDDYTMMDKSGDFA
jgi:hypothetical protein